MHFPSFPLCLYISPVLSITLSAAPSTVSIMHQISRTVDSITLSWSQPAQPNGVILDYELQYYEKVGTHCTLPINKQSALSHLHVNRHT